MAAVRSLLAAAANPEAPNEVDVSQPSDALVARAKAKSALNGLFLGLARSRCWSARSASPTSWSSRFLAEAILLAVLGGLIGVAAGVLATAAYADAKGWAVVVPTLAWGGGFAASLLIGAIAGLMPAPRAARMSPTQALWTG